MGAPFDYSAGQPDPILATVGDINLTQHWVQTPAGTFPIKGSVWTAIDRTQYQESISTAGIVLCVIFIWFCLLGALFLLMKDRKYVGYIQVTVQGNGFHYSTMIPVLHSGTGFDVNNTVNYARSLAAAA